MINAISNWIPFFYPAHYKWSRDLFQTYQESVLSGKDDQNKLANLLNRVKQFTYTLNTEDKTIYHAIFMRLSKEQLSKVVGESVHNTQSAAESLFWRDIQPLFHSAYKIHSLFMQWSCSLITTHVVYSPQEFKDKLLCLIRLKEKIIKNEYRLNNEAQADFLTVFKGLDSTTLQCFLKICKENARTHPHIPFWQDTQSVLTLFFPKQEIQKWVFELFKGRPISSALLSKISNTDYSLDEDDLALFRNLFNILNLPELQLLLDKCLKNNPDHLNIVPFWHQIESILLPLVENIAKLDRECKELLESTRDRIDTTAKEVIELGKKVKEVNKAVEDLKTKPSLSSEQQKQLLNLQKQIAELNKEFEKKSSDLKNKIETFIKGDHEKLLVCIADGGRILPLEQLIHFHALVYNNSHNITWAAVTVLDYRIPTSIRNELSDTFDSIELAMGQSIMNRIKECSYQELRPFPDL